MAASRRVGESCWTFRPLACPMALAALGNYALQATIGNAVSPDGPTLSVVQ